MDTIAPSPWSRDGPKDGLQRVVHLKLGPTPKSGYPLLYRFSFLICDISFWTHAELETNWGQIQPHWDAAKCCHVSWLGVPDFHHLWADQLRVLLYMGICSPLHQLLLASRIRARQIFPEVVSWPEISNQKNTSSSTLSCPTMVFISDMTGLLLEHFWFDRVIVRAWPWDFQSGCGFKPIIRWKRWRMPRRPKWCVPL